MLYLYELSSVKFFDRFMTYTIVGNAFFLNFQTIKRILLKIVTSTQAKCVKNISRTMYISLTAVKIILISPSFGTRDQ